MRAAGATKAQCMHVCCRAGHRWKVWSCNSDAGTHRGPHLQAVTPLIPPSFKPDAASLSVPASGLQRDSSLRGVTGERGGPL